MSKFVRQSKVRHMFATDPKPETLWTNFKLSTATGDHNYIKANPKYIATPIASGNGALSIIRYEDVGKMPAALPCLDGHKGAFFSFFLSFLPSVLRNLCEVVAAFNDDELVESGSRAVVQ